MPEILNNFYKQMSKERPDLVLHAGDWGTCDLHDVDIAMDMYRRQLRKVQTVTVFGNHDYWQTGGSINYKSVVEMGIALRDTAAKYHIDYPFPHSHQLHPNINIYGFDGWYAHDDPPTKDIRFMPRDFEGKPMHIGMRGRAQREFNYMLTNPTPFAVGKPKLLLTHFPMADNPFSAPARWMDFVAPEFDYLVVGHSHRPADYTVGKCRVINPGSDINNPRYVVLEV